jgi:hypothetical protein
MTHIDPIAIRLANTRQYGFKATFSEVCGWIGKTSDVAALQQDGMDIESHTMTLAHLNSVSSSKIV